MIETETRVRRNISLRRHHSFHSFTVAGILLGAFFAPHLALAQTIDVFPVGEIVGLTAGDAYHLAFITDGRIDATDGNVFTYNSMVQAEANAAGIGNTIGLNEWRAIISTSVIDARDNAPISAPVYNTNPDGAELVATGIADMWDGSIAAQIEYDPNRNDVGETDTYTGSLVDGTRDPLSFPGTIQNDTDANTGLNPQLRAWCGHIYDDFSGLSGTEADWIHYFNPPVSVELQVYALSEQMIYAPEPSSATLAAICAAGLFVFRWRRRRS